jgi:hypothetical protein
MTAIAQKGYRFTESKYKGGAHEMYVTYDLKQQTRGEQHAVYPKVKRVYVSGNVMDWKTGIVRNKLGRQVHGVRIEYEQTRRVTADRDMRRVEARRNTRRRQRPSVQPHSGSPK